MLMYTCFARCTHAPCVESFRQNLVFLILGFLTKPFLIVTVTGKKIKTEIQRGSERMEDKKSRCRQRVH